MQAAILTIGDELTCGYRLGTNSQTIACRLTLLPAEVVLHVTANDIPETLQRGLRATKVCPAGAHAQSLAQHPTASKRSFPASGW
ncbi:MAG: hypothetical protein ACP5J4_18295 [Anaerolineae bacterium]